MSREANVLIGALLDRLGKSGAEALLARLDQLLASDTRPHTNRFDRDQIGAIESPHDRRRYDGNAFHKRHSESASPTPKDLQT
jgi:hypothetical protein